MKRTAEDLDLQGCKLMAMAVIKDEIIQYAKALVNLEKNPEDEESQADVKRCERFFRSNQYQILCDFDPEFIMRKTKEHCHAIARRGGRRIEICDCV